MTLFSTASSTDEVSFGVTPLESNRSEVLQLKRHMLK